MAIQAGEPQYATMFFTITVEPWRAKAVAQALATVGERWAAEGGQAFTNARVVDDIDEQLLIGIGTGYGDFRSGEGELAAVNAGYGLEEAAYLAARAVLSSPFGRDARDRLEAEAEAERGAA
jgi:hypothetical protein